MLMRLPPLTGARPVPLLDRYVVKTTWTCGRVTRSRRMPHKQAEWHAAGMRKVCTVVSAEVRIFRMEKPR